jgi:transposase
MSHRHASNPNTVLNEEGAIVGVDIGKTVFQLCIADSQWRAVDTKRLSRSQFERFFANRSIALVVMEACATAHHWARWLQGLGIEVQLIPAQYVRAYVRRNKTDAADAAALLEAARCAEIRPVRVKSIEQQALQTLHRTRAIWVATRTARINALRGFCREFGIAFVQGARRGIDQITQVVADTDSALPDLLRGAMTLMVEEVRPAQPGLQDVAQHPRRRPHHRLVAATAGDVTHFSSARHFGSWLGLTPREHSSANTRQLHGISKRGDNQLRVLLTHGARSVLRTAAVAQTAGRPLDRMRAWAMSLQARANHNKAACALANKLARICYATLRDGKPYVGATAV